MNTRLLKRVRCHFNSEFASRDLNRRNQRAWIASVRSLGSRWKLACPVGRIT